MPKLSSYGALIASQVVESDSVPLLTNAGDNKRVPISEMRQVVGPGYSDTVNAALESGASTEAKISAAIVRAVATGKDRVFIPTSMLPYTASSVTFNSAIQMVREGGDFSVYDVQAYGAHGDGATDDATSIQKAVDGATYVLGGVVSFPQPDEQYLTLSAINCTSSGAVVTPALIFQGSFSPNVDRALIYARHTGHVFDMAGAVDYTFNNITLEGDQFIQPQTGWFLARNAAASGTGRHRFNNCRSRGYFSKAIVYNYASEENEWNDCWFANSTPNTDVVVVTSYNNTNTLGAALTSSFITVATGVQSMLASNFRGGSYWAAGGATANVFHLDGAQGVNGTDLWLYAAQSNANGNALVYINTKNSSSDSIRFKNIIGELGTFYQNYGVYIGGSAGSVTCSGLVIEDWQIPTNTFAVYGDNNAIVYASRIDGLIEPATKGVSLQQFNLSSLRGVNTAVAIRGSMDKTVLHGMPSVWTIAAKTAYVLIDMATGRIQTSTAFKSTFTPVLNLGATPITSYTTQVGSYTVVDDRVFYDLYIVVNVKGAGVGAASITGFPVTSAAGSNYAVAVKLDGANITAGFLSAYIPGASSTLFTQISTYGSPTSNANLADTNVNSGTAFMYSGSYRI